MISGNPFIKKSGSLSDIIVLKYYDRCDEKHLYITGWRKISFYFNLSYEIRDKTIEFDENRNVQRAEFVVRAYMQYVLSFGRFYHEGMI